MSKRAIRKRRHRPDAPVRETFKEAVARGQRQEVVAARQAGYPGGHTNAAREFAKELEKR